MIRLLSASQDPSKDRVKRRKTAQITARRDDAERDLSQVSARLPGHRPCPFHLLLLLAYAVQRAELDIQRKAFTVTIELQACSWRCFTPLSR